MIRQWKNDWMHSGWNFAPEYVALARLFVNDEMKALIRSHGNSQRHFYTVTRLERGVWTKVEGQFQSLEMAKAVCIN
jgi:hypothetical protein